MLNVLSILRYGQPNQTALKTETKEGEACRARALHTGEARVQ